MVRMVVAALLLSACSSPPPAHPAPPSIDDLRFRVASNPRDVDARAKLARALDEDDEPGLALEHWLAIGELPAADRPRVAMLLAERARMRLVRGDPDAHADLRRARRLDDTVVVDELWKSAAGFEVAYQLRLADSVEPVAGLDSGLAGALRAGPERAPVAAVGRVGRWLWSAGTRRTAQRWLRSYVERGGREPATLAVYARSASWWQGLDADLPLTLRRDLADAGALLCGLQAEGCPDVARAVDDPGLGRRLWARTAGLPRTSDPIEAAGWVAVALRVWRAGGRGWLHNLARRVDLKGVAAVGELPLFAAPTLLRAAGHHKRAADALELAVAGAASLSPGQRQVVAHELAVRGDARAAGLGFRELSAGDAVVGARQVSRLWARLAGESGRGSWPLHAARALERAAWQPELVAIATRHATSPAASERLARDYTGAVALPTGRMLAVAELYRGLGDPARARRWASRAADISPRDPRVLLALGLAAHSAGDAPAATILWTRAAGSSGDPGPSYAGIAAVLLERGDALAALEAGKRALPLLPRGRQAALLATLVEANRDLGRRHRVSELIRLGPPEPELSVIDVTDAATAPATPEGWWRAATWNPLAAQPRARLLAAGHGEGQLPVELAVILVAAHPGEARIAGRALIDYFTARSSSSAAEVVQRIIRGI